MGSDVQDAQPGDIYQAPHGSVFIVQAICEGKWVAMKQLIPDGEQEDDVGCRYCAGRVSGGVLGLMWDGFKRISAAPSPTGVKDNG